MVHDRHRGLVKAGLKAEGQKTHKHQEKEQIALGKVQQHKPQAGHSRPQDHDDAGIKAVDQIPHQRAFQGGLEFGEGKRQGRGRPTQVQVGENRQEIQAKARMKRAPLDRFLYAPDDDDPPAIKHLGSALAKSPGVAGVSMSSYFSPPMA